MDKLNLGCGKEILKDFLNVDIRKYPQVDLHFDLDKFPYPLKENQFVYIKMNYVLEHLENVPKVLEELYRISQDNAKIEIIVPHYAGFSRYVDPTHKQSFSYFYFDYFNKKHPRDYQFNCNYKILKKEILFPKHLSWFKPIANKFPGFYETNLCYIFRPSYLKVILEAKKS